MKIRASVRKICEKCRLIRRRGRIIGTRRGTPFAAQTAAGNAIRAVVDQGMQRAEVMIKGPGLGRDAALRAIRRSGILLSFVRDVTPMPHNGCRPPKKRRKVKVSTSTRTRQWKCVESRTDSKRLYYGRFILSPPMKGQADTIGIAMRRALLGELEGTCITRAKFEKIPHEYSTIVGIQESIHEILINLKEIVLRGNLYGTRNAFICMEITSAQRVFGSKVERRKPFTVIHSVSPMEFLFRFISGLKHNHIPVVDADIIARVHSHFFFQFFGGISPV
ncbi:hypothetical protein CXB51_035210 [Gossypium anomalum]|uniref:Ribosomal protein n=50 Tax=Mesangiospermae TaxID=1437183 RepID=A0A8J5Y2G9_9ROSI|nr:hypothetical protein CXB51_035210 [Gossypium anomalum]